MNENDQEFLIQKIRTQYNEKELNGLDELKALDSKVKRPANVFAYLFGSIAALIMGSGMSLVMTDIGAMVGIGDPMIPGIAIGVVGLLMAFINYPIYNRILKKERERIAPEIIRLTDELMK